MQMRLRPRPMFYSQIFETEIDFTSLLLLLLFPLLPLSPRSFRSSSSSFSSLSQVRVYIPRENCLITFLLSGISCPRAERVLPPPQEKIPGEPFGNEALMFTKEHVSREWRHLAEYQTLNCHYVLNVYMYI